MEKPQPGRTRTGAKVEMQQKDRNGSEELRTIEVLNEAIECPRLTPYPQAVAQDQAQALTSCFTGGGRQNDLGDRWGCGLIPVQTSRRIRPG